MTKGQGLVTLAFCTAIFALNAAAAPLVWKTEALRYLSQHNYLPQGVPGNEVSEISEKMFSTAVSRFQSFKRINITGNINLETAHLMSLPRCGVKDKVPSGTSWPRKNLTYKILSYPRSLDRSFIDEEIARAFAVWSNHTDLTFSPMNKKVDIKISFVLGDHGHNDFFDEPARRPITNQLAHASFTSAKNQSMAHFDDFQLWTIDSYRGYNLFQVAAHQIGHSLGLGHSQNDSALMSPLYNSYDPDFKLHEDDVERIQALYGPKSNDTGLDLCKDSQFDTIFNTSEGHVYVFKGNFYWRLKPQGGIIAGYPQLIATVWKGLPDNIDAAFEYRGWTYFFKGSEYWAYVGRQRAGSYPRKIRKDFPDIPNDIDAATVKTGHDEIHFFKGTTLWISDPAKDPSPFGSSSVRYLPNIPNNTNAVLSHDGYTYFFKGDEYFRYDERKKMMDPGNPYKTGPRWFGCPS